ncbi:dihydroorotase family protein [Candidatus Acetothermia bacterium]|nr:dihydroorotase family protein [Candidatus Acetothermia bacterium]MBI3642546.1 dihydroorotase family protein [Candidatus Acetothermia bacterium]
MIRPLKVLTGGELWINGRLTQAEISFGESIEKIDKDLDGERIDCSGLIILPGMIDAHVHFRDFNDSHKEDWQSAGKAAVKGGVTTVLEMPNTNPPTTTLEMIREKKKRASASAVNFGIYGGLTPENIKNIPEIAKQVTAFKLFMGETTGGLEIKNRSMQREIFQRVAETGKVLAVHSQRLDSPSEASDIEVALEHALMSKARLYLCHVRTQEGLQLAYDAKRDVDVTIETCPHYLFFACEDVEKRGSWLKVNPPITSAEDREFLWEALQRGMIDTLGSDHAPHSQEEKSKPFDQAPFGLPGVETSLPLMLNAVNKKRLSLARLIEIFSENPAKRFGYASKGRIAVGNNADLVVVDLERSARVERKDLATKCGWSPYETMELQGWPMLVFVRGKLLFDAR